MRRSYRLIATLVLCAGCALEPPDTTAPSAPPPDPQIVAVESHLPTIHLEGHPKQQLPLEAWMAALEIPGLSLAVIEGGEIVWARGYGVTAARSDEPVTASTQFQAASISKPITALSLLHHVEQGTFDLGAPVNDYLETWKLRDTDGGTEHGVTLRQLLSHTAGVTPGGFPGYAAGEPVPTLLQLLDGEGPAINPSARVVGRPGVQVQYSGLGFEVLQLAMIEHLEQPFPDLIYASLSRPLGLTSTGTEPDTTTSTAKGHDVDGVTIPGGWNRYPETAAAGIWSTPRDLARVLLEVTRALHGESDTVITQAMAQEMLSEVVDGEGLSWVLHLDENGAINAFSHSGGNAGYRAHMRMLPGTGQGLVIMTNSDNGQLLFLPLLHSVAAVYGWPDQPDREVQRHVAVRILAARGLIDMDVPAGLLERYVGRYELEPGVEFEVRLEDGMLTVQLGEQPRLTVFPQSHDTFYYREVNARLTFVLSDDEGLAERLILHQYGQEVPAPRMPDAR